MEKLILLVDDDPAVLGVLKECLRPHYQIRIATQGQTALERARLQPLPDLILLDVKLPDMNGYDICVALKQDPLTTVIPVVFLSSNADEDDITLGLELGAADFVGKPVKPSIVLARVKTQLRLREVGDLLRDQNANLEALVCQRTADLHARTLELQRSQDFLIVALGSIAETRDNETGSHIHRTRAYVKFMAKKLALLPRFKESMTYDQWAIIWKSAPLHDLGKVGIPDYILLKPGKLTPEDFKEMQRHPAIGRDAIHAAEMRMGSGRSFLAVAKEIAYSHHEKWDGSGYPEGLIGEAIPLSARLMAVADVYDALISKRVYKSAMSHEAAVEIIRKSSGSHFDPLIVDCFLDDVDEFKRIAEKFTDNFE
ncbi:MAG: response regulator [Rhodocyclaceae bacterium]|nr:response regulator [Rhodocyclaceae bacterium]